MATGMESSPSSSSSSPGTVEKVVPSGIALDFPVSDAPSSSSLPRIPKRLRQRMSEAKSSPITSVHEIEAKLRNADIRRQQFYEMLSTKARPKPRSPWRSFSQDEVLGQRLEAKLLVAEQKRCWRKFHSSRRTTLELVKDYDALKINENSVKTMPFEQLASVIGSPATLRTVKALLDRLESRYKVCRAVAPSSYSSTLDNIDHLVKRVATPKRRPTPRSYMRSREAKNGGGTRELSRSPAKLSRYSVRVVLCAYMILGHPVAVLSGQGEREAALAKSAKDFIQEFELLIRIILGGPLQSSDDESDSMSSKCCTFRSQLAVFDKAWCIFLNCFVVWKVKDAVSLEEDLVRAACQLELSMIQKCKMSPGVDNNDIYHAMKAIQKQVIDDQKLLREKVRHLSGDAGIERMQSVLDKMRSKYKENGTLIDSPIMNVSSPAMESFAAGAGTPTFTSDVRVETPIRVVRSLFKDENIDSSNQASSSAAVIPSKSASTSATDKSSPSSQLGGSVDNLITDNEVIVNELLHEKRRGLVDRLDTAHKEEESLKVKIKETMEKAFWDGVMNSVKEEGPDYDRVINLVREVRDEISEMAPESWRATIMEAIDLGVLTQVLKSGNLDIEYLGKILEFALATLKKLSSPAHEDEMKVKYQSLLQELTEACQIRDDNAQSSPAVAMIRGLRFVLEQIQTLKSEISKARIRLMEPLLKGPAGLEYLRKAFVNRHGSHLDACSSLPLTKQWLSSLRSCSDQEWEEHNNNSLSVSASHENLSQAFMPSTALRTGGSFQAKQSAAPDTAAPDTGTSNGQPVVVPECSGDRVDLLVRIGLLKLVTEVSGITPETLPETFILNLSRLRGVQAEIQKLIVVTISVLVFRQTLSMERSAATSSADVEHVVSKCSKQLLQLLDSHGDDAGIDEIVGIMSSLVSQDSSSSSGSENVDTRKLQSRKEVMGRMLGRSLQAGDPVFAKVSRAVYSAARGVVLAGSGPKGRKLAEASLRQVGSAALVDRVVEAAELLAVAAGVSLAVHGPWYATLEDSM